MPRRSDFHRQVPSLQQFLVPGDEHVHATRYRFPHHGPGGSLAFLGSAPAERVGVPDSVFGLVLRREGRVEHVFNVAGQP